MRACAERPTPAEVGRPTTFVVTREPAGLRKFVVVAFVEKTTLVSGLEEMSAPSCPRGVCPPLAFTVSVVGVAIEVKMEGTLRDEFTVASAVPTECFSANPALPLADGRLQTPLVGAGTAGVVSKRPQPTTLKSSADDDW